MRRPANPRAYAVVALLNALLWGAVEFFALNRSRRASRLRGTRRA